jgi:hypothetical protein
MDDALLYFEDLKPCGLLVRLVPLGSPSLDRIATED